MRIAMVSEHASPLAVLGGVDAGGQNVHVAALASALARRGHEVEVHTRRDNPAVPQRVQMAPGVVVVHVDAGPPVPLPKDSLLPWMPAFAAVLAAGWREPGRRPDVVHAHFWMSGIAALEAGRALDLPVVITFHALGAVKRRHQGQGDTSAPVRQSAEAALASQVDLVVATCSDEVEELRAMVGPAELAGRVAVVPCGVDVAHFTPTGPVLADPWNHRSGSGTDGAGGPDGSVSPLPPRARSRGSRARRSGAAHRLVTVGRLVERKGVETAVRALAALPDTELLVVGGPPTCELPRDPEAVRLLQVAAELGVGDRVHLLGRVEHADLPAVLRSADVVVAAPWYEPFGIVPLEAMACGRPVVGSAVGGLLDTVEDGVTGTLVRPRDPVALARAVAELLEDPARARARGRAARARVVARFSWARVAALTESAYEDVLAARTVPAGAPRSALGSAHGSALRAAHRAAPRSAQPQEVP